MKKELFILLAILVIIFAGLCGCVEEKKEKKESDGGEGEAEAEGEGEGFKAYEFISDWTDANENSQALTGLEAINLAINNIDVVAPDSQFILSASTDISDEGANKDTGKARAWQMYFHKTSGSDVLRRIVNIAEKGCYIVQDFRDASSIDPWKYSDATTDTDELPAIVASHAETTTWLGEHPQATLEIQTTSGPFGGPKELSWVMWYKDGSDSHQVYISAITGMILE